MNLRHRLALTAAASLLVASTALPLSTLAQSDSQDVTLSITSDNEMIFAVAISYYELYDINFGLSDGYADGELDITVEDERGYAPGWNVRVSNSQFDDGQGHTFPANFNPSDGTVVAGQGAQLPAPQPEPWHGSSFTWNAPAGTGSGDYTLVYYDLNLLVPAGTIAGTYTSTITVEAYQAP